MVNLKVNFITFANLTFKNYKTPFALEYINALKKNQINFNVYCKFVINFNDNYKSLFTLWKIIKFKIFKSSRIEIENAFQLSCIENIIIDKNFIYCMHPGRFNLINNYLKKNELKILNILTGLSYEQELKLIKHYNYEKYYKNNKNNIDCYSDYTISMGSNTFKS